MWGEGGGGCMEAVTCVLSDLNTHAAVNIYTCRTHVRALWVCLGDGDRPEECIKSLENIGAL